MKARTAALLGIFGASAAALAYQRRGELATAGGIVADELASVAGPRGYRNNNPGNLRYIARNPFRGQVGADADGYGTYKTMPEGYRALGQQLKAYQRRGLRTVRSIISTWAPTSENDTAAYITHVSRNLLIDPDTEFNVLAELGKLAFVIVNHENGFNLHPYDQVNAWVNAP